MANAGALTIVLIRHAEKPQAGSDATGLAIDGTPDERALTVRGWQRAGAWAALFGAGLLSDYPAPRAVYAAAPDRSATGHPVSRRPFLTVVPLAERLGLPVRDGFAQGEEARLAAEALASTGVVLIAWEHRRLTTDLLPALLGPDGGTGWQGRWDPARFDVVLRLHRQTPTTPFAVTALYPCLLAGDTAIPMGNS